MKLKRSLIVNGVLVVIGWILAILFYQRLPNPVPVHWNLSGQVNGTMAKPWGALFQPIVLSGLWLVLSILPAISPRGFRVEGFLKTWRVVTFLILGFVLFVEIMSLLKATGAPLALGRLIPVAIGILLIGLGNLMGKLRKNFWMGIRTPWTLADDRVWYKTHRFGAWLFVLGGLVLIGQGIFKGPVGVLIFTVAVLAIAPVVYSYWISPSAAASEDSGGTP